MNCEQNIRIRKSVNQLICTGYSPDTCVSANAPRNGGVNVHAGFPLTRIKLFTSQLRQKNPP
jgi:hypothetical protein